MCHKPMDEATCREIVESAAFFQFLQRVDEDLAAQAQRAGCPCGGKLHRARYPRKPRGVPRKLLGDDYAWRLSFCCATDGCRRRLTPPSVRFLGRVVYLGAVQVLASCLVNPFTVRRAEALGELLGVSLRTLKRWQRWWRDHFLATVFWQQMAGRFTPALNLLDLPASLVRRFTGNGLAEQVSAMLRFLSPLTATPRALHAF